MEQGRSTSLRLGAQKLIPQDLSQSLGKLPPQAKDLEVTVLGALMVETKSILQVPYLKPQHFYDDRHAEVFRAISSLHAEHINPDFRMVIQRLREIGKLDIVGGAHAVIELTSAVSSADNINHHGRVIVEMAIKRALIELASGIQSQAYEDTTDVFDLLKKSQENLTFIEQRETADSGPERIKALWEKYGITFKPERPETLIKIGEADVCTVGNLSLLIGKKKSRKSLLVTHLLWVFLQSRNNVADDIVVFDTEQEEYDVWCARDRLYRMTNQYVAFFCLRGLDPKQRREFISHTITHWPRKLRIAVIDGIRDCMSNINDPDETTMVMSWLMAMNVETKVHFINILHLNKTDNNARGHIGTELLNKAEVTIEVELQTGTDELHPPSVVKCESSRRKPFEQFMFTHGETGLPEILGAPVGQQAQDTEEQLSRLQQVFEGDTLTNKEVRQQICAQFGVGDNSARKLLAEFVRKGWILKSGTYRSPNATYKLNIRSAPPQQSVIIPDPQQNMFDNQAVNCVNTVTPTVDNTPPDQYEPASDDLPF